MITQIVTQDSKNNSKVAYVPAGARLGAGGVAIAQAPARGGAENSVAASDAAGASQAAAKPPAAAQQDQPPRRPPAIPADASSENEVLALAAKKTSPAVTLLFAVLCVITAAAIGYLWTLTPKRPPLDSVPALKPAVAAPQK